MISTKANEVWMALRSAYGGASQFGFNEIVSACCGQANNSPVKDYFSNRKEYFLLLVNATIGIHREYWEEDYLPLPEKIANLIEETSNKICP